MIYVISDLHGYPFEQFKALLDLAPFSDRDSLFILGDVIDRGTDGIKYLQWTMEQPNVTLLLGNHEKMMRTCDYLFEPDVAERMKSLSIEQKRALGLWMANKAEPTVRGLFGISQEERTEIGRYLWTLPVYCRVAAGGKEFLLVHSGLRNFSAEKPLEDYSEDDLLWERPLLTDRYFDNITTVFGHTPTIYYGDEFKGKIIFTDTWIDIDAGAGCGCPPVLLRLNDMKLFCAEDIQED